MKKKSPWRKGRGQVIYFLNVPSSPVTVNELKRCYWSRQPVRRLLCLRSLTLCDPAGLAPAGSQA
jgi:hypothetical protein